jgi:hypothetical protein
VLKEGELKVWTGKSKFDRQTATVKIQALEIEEVSYGRYKFNAAT